MKSNKKAFKNFLILMIAFIAAIFFRVVLADNPYIDNVIGFINVISCLFVCCLIFEVAENMFLNRLDSSKTILGDKIRKHKKQFFDRFYIFSLLLLLILGIFYFVFMANSITNDAISFVALFLSIETDYIGVSIGNLLFNKR